MTRSLRPPQRKPTLRALATNHADIIVGLRGRIGVLEKSVLELQRLRAEDGPMLRTLDIQLRQHIADVAMLRTHDLDELAAERRIRHDTMVRHSDRLSALERPASPRVAPSWVNEARMLVAKERGVEPYDTSWFIGSAVAVLERAIGNPSPTPAAVAQPEQCARCQGIGSILNANKEDGPPSYKCPRCWGTGLQESPSRQECIESAVHFAEENRRSTPPAPPPEPADDLVARAERAIVDLQSNCGCTVDANAAAIIRELLARVRTP
jgi:hypothetical protein